MFISCAYTPRLREITTGGGPTTGSKFRATKPFRALFLFAPSRGAALPPIYLRLGRVLDLAQAVSPKNNPSPFMRMKRR
jgi:hypothetical protein